jgi:hypothetical protein
MPILDGYDACKSIIKHYKAIQKSRIEPIRTRDQKMQWLKDLQTVFNFYCKASPNNTETEQSKIILGYFKQLYSKVIYKALSNLKMPFIFAYSAFVDDKVRSQTNKCGFEGCFEAKLTKQILKSIVKDKISPFAEQVIENNLKDLHELSMMKSAMKGFELESSLPEKASENENESNLRKGLANRSINVNLEGLEESKQFENISAEKY